MPADVLGRSSAPLRVVVEAGSLDGLGAVVRIGAGVAALGVLLNLIPGVSRTALARARNSELPHWFAGIQEKRAIPLRAELAVAIVVIVVVTVKRMRNP